jgi:hypothetical protein
MTPSLNMAGDSLRKRRCTASLESSLGGAARVSSGAEHTKTHPYYQCLRIRIPIIFLSWIRIRILITRVADPDPDPHYFLKLDPDPHSYYQGCGSGSRFALFFDAGSGYTFLLPGLRIRIQMRIISGRWIRIRFKDVIQKLQRLIIESCTLTMEAWGFKMEPWVSIDMWSQITITLKRSWLRIRIRIKVESWIRICIKGMRIHNPAYYLT